MGCPELSRPEPREMWGGKGSRARKKNPNGVGRKMTLKITKEFVIRGRERPMKPLSKLGLSFNLGMERG